MTIRIMLSLLLVYSVYGCATALTSEPGWNTKDSSSSTQLLVFRGSGGANKILKTNFGSESNYVLALKESQYSELFIPAGSHTFRVTTGGAATHRLDVILREGIRTCIRIKGNHAQAAAVLVPILLAAIPSFTASEVDCPSNAGLQSYTYVEPKL